MIVQNDQNIKVPEHLNGEFFVKALKEGLREPQIVLKVLNFEWGSNPGDNYCSAIYRVKVTYDKSKNDSETEEETKSLIVKTIPITQETRFLADVEVFLKEKVTYVDVLPRLEILSKSDKFGAKYFYTVEEPIQTIVFDDLTVDGFKTASRNEGLDWNHSTLILQQLAKLHATSMVLAKKDPAITKRLTKGMLCEETIILSPTFKQMFGGFLLQLVKATANWPGFEKISGHLQRYWDNFESIASKTASPKPNDRYLVMNHGDLWTSNFMYAYDNTSEPNKPTRAIFVDFQLSFYGSPACDLNFFLNTSVHLSILKERRNELIEVYYKTFSETLEYLRYEKIPTLEDLYFELGNRELYGLFAMFAFFPILNIPKDLSGDSSIAAFTTGEQEKKIQATFAQPKLRDFFEFALKRFDKLGVFEEF